MWRFHKLRTGPVLGTSGRRCSRCLGWSIWKSVDVWLTYIKCTRIIHSSEMVVFSHWKKKTTDVLLGVAVNTVMDLPIFFPFVSTWQLTQTDIRRNCQVKSYVIAYVQYIAWNIPESVATCVGRTVYCHSCTQALQAYGCRHCCVASDTVALMSTYVFLHIWVVTCNSGAEHRAWSSLDSLMECASVQQTLIQDCVMHSGHNLAHGPMPTRKL